MPIEKPSGVTTFLATCPVVTFLEIFFQNVGFRSPSNDISLVSVWETESMSGHTDRYSSIL
jgi:hypothetical protein